MATSKITQAAHKERNMKSGAFKALLLSSAVAGLAGVSGAASAQAFTATATVQNAVTITQVTPLTFGTVFATKTATGTSGADGTYSRKLTLAPAGTVSQVANTAGTAPSLLSLSGATAGQYSAPSLPSGATVGVNFSTVTDVVFTQAASVAAASCAYNDSDAAIAANKIVLRNGAAPTTGFFCLDAFTSNRTGLVPALGSAVATGYALGFGITTLTFDLGATLVAQTPLTATQNTYASGLYTGSFKMEVVFP